MKSCKWCLYEKQNDGFHRKKSSKDGLQSICKECSRDYSKRIRSKNPEKHAKQYNEWKERNRDYLRTYRESRKTERREATTRYKERNRALILARQRERRKRQRESINENRRIRDRERYNSDHLYRIEKVCRARINEVIKRGGYWKTESIKKIIGCSYPSLKKHIESMFRPGMSWDNHGEWHIDHIIPLSSASNEKELMPLFRYTNLQPLWSGENLSKGKKVPDEVYIAQSSIGDARG